MTITAAGITAITDLVLAGEALFLAGRLSGRPMTRFSAAWFWSGALLLTGVAALLGGIDHGFFEASGQPRYWIERPNWIVLAATTFCVLTTTAKQFFSPGARRAILILGIVQFAGETILVLLVDSFLVVILNYAPVMILLLAMNFIELKKGAGSWQMITGILVLFAGSAVQAAGMDVFAPLDHNGMYHLVSMIAMAFLYRGGERLQKA